MNSTTEITLGGISPAANNPFPQVNPAQKSDVVKVMQKVLAKKDDAAFQEYEEGYNNALKLNETLQKSLQTEKQKNALLESKIVILETQNKEAAITHAAALKSSEKVNIELKTQVAKQENEILRFIRNEKIYEEEFIRQVNEQRDFIRMTPQSEHGLEMQRIIIAQHESIINHLLQIRQNTSKKL